MAEVPDVIIFVIIAAVILVAMKLVGKTIKIILWIILVLFAISMIIGPQRLLAILGL